MARRTMLDRLVELAGLMRDDAEHVRGLGVVRLGCGGAAGELVGIGQKAVAALLLGKNERLAGTSIACAGAATGATARAASTAMIAAACAARRSPSALNGGQRRVVALRDRLELLGDARDDGGPGLALLLAEQAHGRIPGIVLALEHASASRVTHGISTHTGLPSAPARCATEVSTVITRSSAAIAAAVSAKSSSSGDKIVDRELGPAELLEIGRVRAELQARETRCRAPQTAAPAPEVRSSAGNHWRARDCRPRPRRS